MGFVFYVLREFFDWLSTILIFVIGFSLRETDSSWFNTLITNVSKNLLVIRKGMK